MSSEIEYRAEMQKLLLIGGSLVAIAEAMPLKEMADCVRHAEDFGPIFDPTQWMRAQGDGRLKHQREAIAAAQEFVRAWRAAGLPVSGDEETTR